MQVTRSLIYVATSEASCQLEKARGAVSEIPGIFDVDANHLSNLLTIDYDQERVSLAQIRRTIREACEHQLAIISFIGNLP
jgi:copper chaperone CopZ